MTPSGPARFRAGQPVATVAEGAPGRARLPELDLFKTLLVVGMVAAHVMQLVGRMLPDWTEDFGDFINLITFSGFMFAMGIGLGLASGRGRPWWRRLLPIVLLLVAAWSSSFAFAMLVDRVPLTAKLAFDVLTMRRLFGWSEFLATFFVLYVFVALTRPLLIWVATNPFPLILASVACLGSTWLEMNQSWPLTATLIGTTEFACFPLVPYLPWFLLGIAIGRAHGRAAIWHWLCALVASGWLAWSLWQTGELPERFPPTVLWITGSALPLLIYFSVARFVAARVTLPGWLTLPGRHVLSYLLVSNLVLFLLRNQMGRPVFNVWMWLSLTTAIVVAIGAAWLIWELWRNRRSGRTLSRSAPA
jgi:hypothetical protein